MGKAVYKRGEIRTALYANASGAAIPVDTIIIGGLIHNKKSSILVARNAIANGTSGIVAVSGVFNFPKIAAAVIKAGEAVIWDATNDGVEDNAHTAAVGDVIEFGRAMHDAGDGVTRIDVEINAPGTYKGA